MVEREENDMVLKIGKEKKKKKERKKQWETWDIAYLQRAHV
jgi:hypothetical protein